MREPAASGDPARRDHRGIAAAALVVAAIIDACAILVYLPYSQELQSIPVAEGLAFLLLVVALPMLMWGSALASFRSHGGLARAGWLLLLAGAGVSALSIFAVGNPGVYPAPIRADAGAMVRFPRDAGAPVAVAVASQVSCAMTSDGRVWCWGVHASADASGQTLASPSTGHAEPSPVRGISQASALWSDGLRLCAIDGGRIRCWTGADGPLSELVDLADVTQFTHWMGSHPGPYYTNSDHGCAVAGGRVWCWGTDPTASGVLGAGPIASTADGGSGGPRVVTGIPNATAVSTAGLATCATVLTAGSRSGDIACWGIGAYRAFGRDVPPDPGTPFIVPSGGAPAWFPVNPWPLCTPTAMGPDDCEAYLRLQPASATNANEDLVYEDLAGNVIPSEVPHGITDVSDGVGGGCGLAGQGVWCWPDPRWWDMWTPPWSPLDRLTSPTKVSVLAGTTSIAVAYEHACAVRDGSVVCWGRNYLGELGVPPRPDTAAVARYLLGPAFSLFVLLVASAAALALRSDIKRRAVDPGARLASSAARAVTNRLLVFVVAASFLGVFRPEDPHAWPVSMQLLLVPVAAGSWLSLQPPRLNVGRHGIGWFIVPILAGLAMVLAQVVGTLVPLASYLRVPTYGWDSRSNADAMVNLAYLGFAGLALCLLLVPPVLRDFSDEFRVQWAGARGIRQKATVLRHPVRIAEASISARAIETERGRLAAELHAEVLPALYRSIREAERGGSVERLSLDLQAAVADVEGMLSRRRSIVLEELGLLAALEWLAERTEERTDLAVEIDVAEAATEAGIRPPRPVERAAFRVAGLALENSAKHAPGSTVRIRLSLTPTSVGLELADDGPGLGRTTEAALRLGRRGLADMAAEADTAGARVTVATADPGADRPGTIVRFTWPG
jgi:signal transduction histidine kinase